MRLSQLADVWHSVARFIMHVVDILFFLFFHYIFIWIRFCEMHIMLKTQTKCAISREWYTGRQRRNLFGFFKIHSLHRTEARQTPKLACHGDEKPHLVCRVATLYALHNVILIQRLFSYLSHVITLFISIYVWLDARCSFGRNCSRSVWSLW